MTYQGYAYPYSRPMKEAHFKNFSRLILVALLEGHTIDTEDPTFRSECKQAVSHIDATLPDEPVPEWVCMAVVG